MLLVIKDIHDNSNLSLATARNASMQGVGTKMGTAFGSPSNAVDPRTGSPRTCSPVRRS